MIESAMLIVLILSAMLIVLILVGLSAGRLVAGWICDRQRRRALVKSLREAVRHGSPPRHVNCRCDAAPIMGSVTGRLSTASPHIQDIPRPSGSRARGPGYPAWVAQQRAQAVKDAEEEAEDAEAAKACLHTSYVEEGCEHRSTVWLKPGFNMRLVVDGVGTIRIQDQIGVGPTHRRLIIHQDIMDRCEEDDADDPICV